MIYHALSLIFTMIHTPRRLIPTAFSLPTPFPQKQSNSLLASIQGIFKRSLPFFFQSIGISVCSFYRKSWGGHAFAFFSFSFLLLYAYYVEYV